MSFVESYQVVKFFKFCFMEFDRDVEIDFTSTSLLQLLGLCRKLHLASATGPSCFEFTRPLVGAGMEVEQHAMTW